jgi:hypothetical protein
MIGDAEPLIMRSLAVTLALIAAIPATTLAQESKPSAAKVLELRQPRVQILCDSIVSEVCFEILARNVGIQTEPQKPKIFCAEHKAMMDEATCMDLMDRLQKFQ